MPMCSALAVWCFLIACQLSIRLGIFVETVAKNLAQLPSLCEDKQGEGVTHAV